jgi:nitroreductase
MERPAPADHPIHELLSKRWSPRAYAEELLADEEVARLFEAARWAPSSYNEQPWAFLVAGRGDQEVFGRALKGLVDVNQVWAQSAGLLAFGLARPTFVKGDRPNRHALYDLGGAVAQLTVQATSMGLFVHQLAGIDPDRVRADHGVPDDWEVVVGLAIGRYGDIEKLPEVYAEREAAPRTRKPLEDFVFQGEWGQRPDFLGDA